MPTVQLLLNAGAWLPTKRFDCLLMATRAGSSEVVEALCTAAATAAAATTAATAVDVTDSVAGGTVKGGCTLMHAAAAARSLRCAEVLLRHGVDAAAVTDNVPGKEHVSGLSALDLLVMECPHRKIVPHNSLLQCTSAEFEQFALLLLSCGATVKYTAMTAEQHYMLARVLHKHTQRQQQQLRKTVGLAKLQAAAHWYECNADSGSSSGSSSSDRSSSNTVRVQLVHAVTKQRSKRVYVVNTQLLSQLYSYTAAGALSTTASAPSVTNNSTAAAAIATEQLSSSSSGDSKVASSSSTAIQAAARQNVLVKMLVPPEGWQTFSTNELKLISYDGKCIYLAVLIRELDRTLRTLVRLCIALF
jgi:hypothetical protein